MSLGCFGDTETPTRWKKLTSCWPQACWPQARWSQTSWNQKVDDVDSQNTTRLPHHQPIKIMSTSWSCTCNPSPHRVIKHVSLKAIREFGSFEHELPILLSWPCNQHYTFLHHNPGSVDWVYCTGDQTQVWFSNNITQRTSCFEQWILQKVLWPRILENKYTKVIECDYV